MMEKHDFLVHHGIIGQKWGERRYQYQDGSLTPEGRRRYGLSDNSSKTNEDIRKELNRSALENRYANAMVRSKTKNNARELAKNVFGTVANTLNTSAAYGKAAGVITKADLDVARRLNDASAEQYFTKRGESLRDFTNASKIGAQGANAGKSIMNFNFDEQKVQKIKKSLGKFSDEELKKMVERAELERKYEDDVKNKKFNDTIASVNGCLSAVGSIVGITAAAISIYATLTNPKNQS